MPTRYDDFDLVFRRNGEGYAVQLINSPTGQAESEFALPFTEGEMRRFYGRIGQLSRMRSANSPDMAAAKQFGGKLFDAVFQGELLGRLRSSSDSTRLTNRGLRLRLRLRDAPALAELPWEFLYDREQDHFLATSTMTPMVRYLDMAQRVSALKVHLPLRILVVIASPQNLQRLDAEGEWDRLRMSLAELESSGLIVLERLEGGTLDALRRRATHEAFHILHFVGHGSFDANAGEGCLHFENDKGMSEAVQGSYLGNILRDHPSVRLVVLNACEGARQSTEDPFSGVAQSLCQQQMPAVVAMQFEISDDAAKRFAEEFYAAVANCIPVDAAVAESRKSMFTGRFGQEWATPVLYMRSPDGLLFDVQRKRVPRPPVALAEAKATRLQEAERQQELLRQEEQRKERERIAAAELAEKQRREAEAAEAERARQETLRQEAAARAEAERKDRIAAAELAEERRREAEAAEAERVRQDTLREEAAAQADAERKTAEEAKKQQAATKAFFENIDRAREAKAAAAAELAEKQSREAGAAEAERVRQVEAELKAAEEAKKQQAAAEQMKSFFQQVESKRLEKAEAEAEKARLAEVERMEAERKAVLDKAKRTSEALAAQAKRRAAEREATMRSFGALVLNANEDAERKQAEAELDAAKRKSEAGGETPPAPPIPLPHPEGERQAPPASQQWSGQRLVPLRGVVQGAPVVKVAAARLEDTTKPRTPGQVLALAAVMLALAAAAFVWGIMVQMTTGYGSVTGFLLGLLLAVVGGVVTRLVSRGMRARWLVWIGLPVFATAFVAACQGVDGRFAIACVSMVVIWGIATWKSSKPAA